MSVQYQPSPCKGMPSSGFGSVVGQSKHYDPHRLQSPPTNAVPVRDYTAPTGVQTRQPPNPPGHVTYPQGSFPPSLSTGATLEGQQGHNASALLGRFHTLERNPPQTTRQNDKESQKYMRVLKICGVLCLLLIIAGGVLMGVGEADDLDDIEDGEDAIFLVGIILLCVGSILVVVIIICGCVLKQRGDDKNSRDQRNTSSRYDPAMADDVYVEINQHVPGVQNAPRYVPNPLYGQDMSGAVIGTPLFSSAMSTGVPPSVASPPRLVDHTQRDPNSMQAQTMPAPERPMLSMICEGDEPPLYEEADSRAFQSFPKLMSSTLPPVPANAHPKAPPPYDIA